MRYLNMDSATIVPPDSHLFVHQFTAYFNFDEIYRSDDF